MDQSFKMSIFALESIDFRLLSARGYSGRETLLLYSMWWGRVITRIGSRFIIGGLHYVRGIAMEHGLLLVLCL